MLGIFGERHLNRRWRPRVAWVLATLATYAGGVVADEQAVPSELEADIERLMEVTKAADMGRQFGDLMAQQMVQLTGVDTPESVARCRVIAAETITELLSDGSLLDELVPIYARHFTHQDVRNMIAFYETPLGRKMLEVTPRIMQESMQLGQQWALRVMPGVQEKVTARLKAEGLID